MNWTTTPPTEPGWYWWRADANEEPEIVLVVNRLNFLGAYLTNVIGIQRIHKIGGEWWPIPIEEPKP